MIRYKKGIELEIEVKDLKELVEARAILELKFEKADWKTDDYGTNRTIIVNRDGVVHSHNNLLSNNRYTLNELKEWAQAGFPFVRKTEELRGVISKTINQLEKIMEELDED